MIEVNFRPTYTARLEEDENGDLVLPLPEELLEELNWQIDDTLEWKVLENGNIILNKKR